MKAVLLKLTICACFLQTRRALAAPTVRLDNGVFTGTTAATSPNTQSFLGIPFAKPPVGPLRFNLPVPNAPYNGLFNANITARTCPQQALVLPDLSRYPGLQKVVAPLFGGTGRNLSSPSEDCLTIDVVRPATVTPLHRLPVVVFIYGGAFAFGSTSVYDGTFVVERSIALHEPVIYVAMNYRVSALGFLPGKEVRAAGVGNLGLHDQRLALRWVQKYISAFGGDPHRVTIWGESAGAISVAMHMITNGGKTDGLFHAAFMQSGSPIPVGSLENGQKHYDAFVQQTNCSHARDTLACLRTVPIEIIEDVQNKSPGPMSYSTFLAWLPRTDGIFLTDNPQRLVQQKSIANVPIVTGDCDDEGTLFALSTTNLTTDAEFLQWVQEFWFPHASTAELQNLNTHYPSTLPQGSPFDTGNLNGVTPQFKRLAAYSGDLIFDAARRFFQQAMPWEQHQWAFLSKRRKDLPYMGSFHGSDLSPIFSQNYTELKDALIHFTNHHDPNGLTVPIWPRYSTVAPQMLTLHDGVPATTITWDTFRRDGIRFLNDLTIEHPL